MLVKPGASGLRQHVAMTRPIPAGTTRRIAAACLCALLAVVAAPQLRAHHAPGPVRIAAVLSVTGPAAAVGEPQLKALQLYVERLNRDGGLLSHKVELFHADDASDPKKAAEAARKLATPEYADMLIGGSITSTAIAILPILQKAKIPYIAIATGSRITEPSRMWVFRTPPSESMAVLRILDDLARRGAKRVSMVSMDTESGRTARRDVLQYTSPASLYYRKAGIELAAERVFAPEDAEGAAQALTQALQGRDADAVIAVAFGNAAMGIARRHRESGAKAQLYFTHAAAERGFPALAAAEGARVTVPPLLVAEQLAADDPQKKIILDFVAAYTARYGEAPPPSAGYAADALMLAANAIREARSLDFVHMRQVLEGTRDFIGVTGTFNIWATDHRAVDPKALRLAEIRGGAYRLLD